MRKIVLIGMVGLALILGLVACSGSGNDENTIRVGSKDFTENLIVAELYSLALEDAGYDVERTFNIAGSVIHTSITSDEIDLYPEYTGTGLLSILQMGLLTDPEEVYSTVKEEYDNQFDITWLDYAEANDGQGLVIRTEASEELGITTISDLQKHAEGLRFASQGEFDQREDGIPALEKTYGEFNWKSSKVYDNGLKYEVLKNDEADVTPAYTTEGQLVNTDLFTLLEDDKQVWPPYNLAPVVRNEVLEANPEIADVINKVSAALDTATITELNAKVDVDKEEYEEVAKEYYESIQ
ncbi:glycine betaine ABC transporter substrate-binding protein [Bacillaceae bacterium S4-13-58]